MQEFNLGSAENLKYNKVEGWDGLRMAYDCFFDGAIMPVGSDSPFSFQKRIFDGLNELPEVTSAVFCHSGIIKLFLRMMKYDHEYLGNLAMILVEFDDIYEDLQVMGVFHGYKH